MLIDFSVGNFGPIQAEMTLSAEAGEYVNQFQATNTFVENDIRLLKSLVVLGPNGSGKSSLIAALKLMRHMVLNNPTSITNRLPYSPFKLTAGMDNQSTDFRIRFNAQGQTLEYAFSYQANEITSEVLTRFVKNVKQVYFSRRNQSFDVLPDQLETVAKHTKKNSLLLFNAQAANDALAIAAMQWFQDKLVFVQDTVVPDDLANLLEDDQLKQKLLRFLYFADFQIKDIHVVTRPPLPAVLSQLTTLAKLDLALPEITTPSKMLYIVYNRYDATGTIIGKQEMPLAQEAKGLQKLLLIVLTIIKAQRDNNGQTLLLDDFSDTLHVELSKALLQLFNTKQNYMQFIGTTKEPQLLKGNLRRDQIYLIEKDFRGRSSLLSIFDFKTSGDAAAQDAGVMQHYQEGRYGGLPLIDAQEMLKSLNFKDKASPE